MNEKEHNELREISITRNYTKYAEGSVLVCFGDTKVVCTASVVSGVPRWLKGSGRGWVTAEYGLLPRSTKDRTQREATKNGQTGRTQEIQRLIGRALRAAVSLEELGEHTITIDCDVIQADGGTRTASITGGCVALYDAIESLRKRNAIKTNPFKLFIAAVSVGIYKGEYVLDLNYEEDCKASTDMNFVMTEKGDFIEIQGTAESKPFNGQDLNKMLELARKGIEELIVCQRENCF